MGNTFSDFNITIGNSGIVDNRKGPEIDDETFRQRLEMFRNIGPNNLRPRNDPTPEQGVLDRYQACLEEEEESDEDVDTEEVLAIGEKSPMRRDVADFCKQM